VLAREFGHHHRPECRDHRLGEIGVLRGCLEGIRDPAQVMHTDAEMPFPRP
jgi:hypothetical protein